MLRGANRAVKLAKFDWEAGRRARMISGMVSGNRNTSETDSEQARKGVCAISIPLGAATGSRIDIRVAGKDRRKQRS
jgi:hypothetical protein